MPELYIFRVPTSTTRRRVDFCHGVRLRPICTCGCARPSPRACTARQSLAIGFGDRLFRKTLFTRLRARPPPLVSVGVPGAELLSALGKPRHAPAQRTRRAHGGAIGLRLCARPRPLFRNPRRRVRASSTVCSALRPSTPKPCSCFTGTHIHALDRPSCSQVME